MERDHWYSVQRHLAKLEPPAEIGRKAAARALRRLGARQIETREVPVVFDPDMAGSLLRHLAAAVSGNALYKGMSFLTGKLGERIAPAFVHVHDDGTLRGALARSRSTAKACRPVARRWSRLACSQLPVRHLLGAQDAKPLDR
jgi:PmbA protein